MNVLYTSMRPMGSMRISSRNQNICLRSFCNKHNMIFSLPIPEFVYPNCFVQLFNIIKSPSYQGSNLVFYSVHQFTDYPGDISTISDSLFYTFCSVNFALEDQSFAKGQVSDFMEFLLTNITSLRTTQ